MAIGTPSFISIFAVNFDCAFVGDVPATACGQTACVRVSRRGIPVVQITIIRKETPVRPRLGFAKGKFRLPTWDEDKAMDREIENSFAA